MAFSKCIAELLRYDVSVLTYQPPTFSRGRIIKYTLKIGIRKLLGTSRFSFAGVWMTLNYWMIIGYGKRTICPCRSRLLGVRGRKRTPGTVSREARSEPAGGHHGKADPQRGQRNQHNHEAPPPFAIQSKMEIEAEAVSIIQKGQDESARRKPRTCYRTGVADT